ncbi:MAG TPA: carboxypeptidase-like regulatory domain-containing protein [Longimicrobiales bacterium]
MPDLAPRTRAARRGHAITLLAAAALCLAAAPAAAQVVRGTVVEATTGTPIGQAEVVLVDDGGKERRRVITDTHGLFLLEAPEAGRYTLAVRRIGFVAVQTPVVDVSESEAVAVEIRMSAEAIPLEPLVVVQRRWYGIARLDEFYRRADWNSKLGRGRIYYRDDIEHYASLRHLFAMVPQGRSCPMQILVDGLPISEMEELDAFAHPDDVEGVEIYRGPAQVPPEYAHLATCGIALVWTRPTRGKPFTWKRFFIAVGLAGLMVLLANQ